MGRVNSEAAALLVAGICRGKFWATPEETERWLKTETGQRFRKRIRQRKPGNQGGSPFQQAKTHNPTGTGSEDGYSTASG